MLGKSWPVVLTLCLLFGSFGSGQQPAEPSKEQARIEALVRKLSSPSYAQRELARKEIEAIGTPALEPLRRARTTDTEAKRRIADLIRLFEDQVLTRQILAPKEVTLNLADVTPSEAVQELAKASGYQVQIQGDATKFADKKINLNGKYTFWQALDQICEKAGLMEKIDVTTELTQPQIMPGKGGIRRIQPVPAPAPAGPIVLIARGNEKSVVSYAGAVKTEVRISREAGKKELKLLFVVSAEPRLLNHMVQGRPVLDKILDDQGRKLKIAPDAPEIQAFKAEDFEKMARISEIGGTQANRRVTQIYVKDGEQAAKQLKELAGKLSLQLDLQNVILARLDKVMDAAGKSVDGVNGGVLKVQSVKKADNGDITIQVSIENIGPNPFGNNIIIQGGGGIVIRGGFQGGGIVINGGNIRINGGGNGSRDGLPDLVDAKGQKFKLANVTGDNFNMVNGSTARTATLLFQANPGQAEPSELVVFGTRTHTIAVPFRFENLPLP